jgi:hypothetical protein
MTDRYVQLPNGSYLQWPEGVPAATFKAKATKLMGESAKPQPSVPNGTISAYKPDIPQRLEDLRQRLSEFANRGSGSYKVGQTSEIGDLMASGPLGLLRMGKGAAEVPQGKEWQATKDIVGGGIEAAKIPSMMFAPEGAGFTKGLLPSTEKAGKLLDAVEQAAGHVPIDLTGPMKEAGEIIKNAQSGGSRPKVIADFIRRINDPNKPPLTYAEARKFYENAGSRLATDVQGQVLKGKPKYMLTKFQKALDAANQGAAGKVGQGQAYADAMRAYSKASKFESSGRWAAKKAIKGAGIAGGSVAAGMGAKAGYDLMRSK